MWTDHVDAIGGRVIYEFDVPIYSIHWPAGGATAGQTSILTSGSGKSRWCSRRFAGFDEGFSRLDAIYQRLARERECEELHWSGHHGHWQTLFWHTQVYADTHASNSSYSCISSPAVLYHFFNLANFTHTHSHLLTVQKHIAVLWRIKICLRNEECPCWWAPNFGFI